MIKRLIGLIFLSGCTSADEIVQYNQNQFSISVPYARNGYSGDAEETSEAFNNAKEFCSEKNATLEEKKYVKKDVGGTLYFSCLNSKN